MSEDTLFPTEDWHIKDTGRYTKPDIFVEQFASALLDYLVEGMGDREHHIIDYGASTLSFSQAFFNITQRF